MQCLLPLKRFLTLGLCLLVVVACNSSQTAEEDVPPPSPPQGTTEPFDLTLALELSRLNLQAYQQLENFLDERSFSLPAPYILEEQLFTSVRFAGDIFDDAERVPIGFVASAGNALYVVFRGTEAISEWLADVTFPQEAFTFVPNSGMTHQGFTNVYQNFRQNMLTAVRNLINTGRYSRLYVVGHSLGGAIAVLATLELGNSAGLTPIMYNYGAPRVGDPTFRERYLTLIQTSWRVVNTNDVVPDVPLTTLFVGFPPREITYQHVFGARNVTFGTRINDPLDVLRVRSNHNLCNYYNALCAETNDAAGCRALAAGVSECNP